MTQLGVPFAISCLTFVIAGGGESATDKPCTPTLAGTWTPAANNRFFPLTPEASFTFAGMVAGGEEETVVEVLLATKVIPGGDSGCRARESLAPKNGAERRQLTRCVR